MFSNKKLLSRQYTMAAIACYLGLHANIKKFTVATYFFCYTSEPATSMSSPKFNNYVIYVAYMYRGDINFVNCDLVK